MEMGMNLKKKTGEKHEVILAILGNHSYFIFLQIPRYYNTATMNEFLPKFVSLQCLVFFFLSLLKPVQLDT